MKLKSTFMLIIIGILLAITTSVYATNVTNYTNGNIGTVVTDKGTVNGENIDHTQINVNENNVNYNDSQMGINVGENGINYNDSELGISVGENGISYNDPQLGISIDGNGVSVNIGNQVAGENGENNVQGVQAITVGSDGIVHISEDNNKSSMTIWNYLMIGLLFIVAFLILVFGIYKIKKRKGQVVVK